MCGNNKVSSTFTHYRVRLSTCLCCVIFMSLNDLTHLGYKLCRIDCKGCNICNTVKK